MKRVFTSEDRQKISGIFSIRWEEEDDQKIIGWIRTMRPQEYNNYNIQRIIQKLEANERKIRGPIREKGEFQRRYKN